jgi:hypothetical protein
VQVRRTDDAARCWGSTFETSRRNSGKRFGADAGQRKARRSPAR